MFRKTGSDWQLGTNATKFVLEGLQGEAAEIASELMSSDVNTFLKTQRHNFQLGSIPTMNTARATPLGRYSFVNNGRNSTMRMQPSRSVAQISQDIKTFRDMVSQAPEPPPPEEMPPPPSDEKYPQFNEMQARKERLKMQREIVATMVPRPCWFIDFFDYTPSYGSPFTYTLTADAWGESKIYNLGGDRSISYIFSSAANGPVTIPTITQPLGTFEFSAGNVPVGQYSSDPCGTGQRVLLNLTEGELAEHLSLTQSKAFYVAPVNYEPDQFFNPIHYYAVNYANNLMWNVSKIQLVKGTRLTDTEYIQKYVRTGFNSPYGSATYFQPTVSQETGILYATYIAGVFNFKVISLAGYRLPNGKFMPLPKPYYAMCSFEASYDCLVSLFTTPATFQNVSGDATRPLSLYELAVRIALASGKFTSAPPPFISEDLIYKMLYAYTQEPIPKGLGEVW